MEPSVGGWGWSASPPLTAASDLVVALSQWLIGFAHRTSDAACISWMCRITGTGIDGIGERTDDDRRISRCQQVQLVSCSNVIRETTMRREDAGAWRRRGLFREKCSADSLDPYNKR
jgi:hypothetical protein